MYLVFNIKNESEVNYLQNYEAISINPNNRELCIARERWQEINYAKTYFRCLFWNGDKLTLPDFSEYKIEHLTRKLFPRIQTTEVKSFHNFLRKNKILQYGISSPSDFYLIEHWIDVVPKDYTKRDMTVIDKALCKIQLKECFAKYNRNNKFFIKSLHKDFSYDGSLEGFYEWEVNRCLEKGNDNDPIIISEWVEIEEDELGQKEYRCFFINSELISISRYLDYEDHVIPKDVEYFAEKIGNELLGSYLPKNIVVDLAVTKDRGIIFLEANDVMCSGRYVLNKIEGFF
jgi:hypothetical protein